LTAAHCFDWNSTSLEPKDWLVVAGSISKFPTDSNKKFEIKEIKPHPEFVKKAILDDIAILTMKKEFKYSKNLQPMKMSNSFEWPKGKNMFIMMNRDF
jgi:secreted trypsin-like serine protease